MLNFLARCKKQVGLIGPDTKKNTGTVKHRLGWGEQYLWKGDVSASGLCPWGIISASRLCPGGQNMWGDRIYSDSGIGIVGTVNITP